MFCQWHMGTEALKKQNKTKQSKTDKQKSREVYGALTKLSKRKEVNSSLLVNALGWSMKEAN